jgi:hypothetical protein
MTARSIIHQGKPSRTAETTAVLRGVHHLLDDPLVLRDPHALRILGAEERLRSDAVSERIMRPRPLRRETRQTDKPR